MAPRPPTAGLKLKRYEMVADRVVSLIRKGSLKPGERIPSIRKMSQQASASISTVLEAYRLLEDQGCIEARPQSGYYVRPKHLRRMRTVDAPPEPEIQRRPLTAAAVRTEDALIRNMNISRQPNLIPLGAALPSPDFLPTKQLNRMLARVVREDPSLASRYEVSPGLEELRANCHPTDRRRLHVKPRRNHRHGGRYGGLIAKPTSIDQPWGYGGGGIALLFWVALFAALLAVACRGSQHASTHGDLIGRAGTITLRQDTMQAGGAESQRS